MPLPFLKSRKFRLSLLFLVGIYILSLALFYLFRNKVIFQSTSLSSNYQFEFSQPYQEYFIEVSDGTKLDALLFKASTPSKGLIFYTHGNADNLQRWGNYAVDFTTLGYDVKLAQASRLCSKRTVLYFIRDIPCASGVLKLSLCLPGRKT